MPLKPINHIKLSELTLLIKEAMQSRFGEQTFWVLGEVSGHKFYANPDRHYFELLEKEAADKSPVAKVKSIAWTSGSERIAAFEQETMQKFENGMQVLVQIKIEFNAAYGFQLIILDVDPNYTIGKIEQQRRDTLRKLLLENPGKIFKQGNEYITFNKQQKLKRVIHQMALIGSPNSEGFSDFCHTLQTNQYNYRFKIDIFQSAVQGATADIEIKAKLIQVFESNTQYDVVIIIRGGGSKSDLLTFDSYGLAQTIARFPIPIITGLGHHNDVSISDLMAHTATKTPTKAAEFIISHNRSFEESLLVLQRRLIIKSQQIVYLKQQEIAATKELVVNRVQGLLNNYALKLSSLQGQLLVQPKAFIGKKSSEIQYYKQGLKLNLDGFIRKNNHDLAHYASLIKVMSPENILKKGFAYLQVKGKIVSDVNGLQAHDELTVVTAKHILNTKIESINETNKS